MRFKIVTEKVVELVTNLSCLIEHLFTSLLAAFIVKFQCSLQIPVLV